MFDKREATFWIREVAFTTNHMMRENITIGEEYWQSIESVVFEDEFYKTFDMVGKLCRIVSHIKRTNLMLHIRPW